MFNVWFVGLKIETQIVTWDERMYNHNDLTMRICREIMQKTMLISNARNKFEYYREIRERYRSL